MRLNISCLYFNEVVFVSDIVLTSVVGLLINLAFLIE